MSISIRRRASDECLQNYYQQNNSHSSGPRARGTPPNAAMSVVVGSSEDPGVPSFEAHESCRLSEPFGSSDAPRFLSQIQFFSSGSSTASLYHLLVHRVVVFDEVFLIED